MARRRRFRCRSSDDRELRCDGAELRQRVAAYTVRIGLTARDASLPISYTVDLRAGRTLLDLKRASTTSGRATITVRARPSARCPQCADSAYRVRRSRKRNEYLAGTPLAIARRTRVQRERACEEVHESAPSKGVRPPSGFDRQHEGVRRSGQIVEVSRSGRADSSARLQPSRVRTRLHHAHRRTQDQQPPSVELCARRSKLKRRSV